MQTLIVHGRQPALGRAELESIYGAKRLRSVDEIATLIDIEPKEVDFMRLGGMVKFCKVLTKLPATEWQAIEKFLIETTPSHFDMLPEGKLKIGLSAYKLKVTSKQLHKTALKLKSAGKDKGRSIRIIPNKNTTLNAATVLNNKLTKKLGWELVFIKDGNETIVAQSIAVQDIDRYAARDQARPCRDARVGMLPPKLAQTIVNLATGNKKLGDLIILDSFCGTGVILQEANLMGINSLYGSDIDQRMLDYTKSNLEWLKKQFGVSHTIRLEKNNAATAEYTNFDVIASETYLGEPSPKPTELRQIITGCEELHEKFLKNVARQTGPGFRMCLGVPAWVVQNPKSQLPNPKFWHLSTLDKLRELGYNRLSFKYSTSEELIYHRPGQVTARELVVLERI